MEKVENESGKLYKYRKINLNTTYNNIGWDQATQTVQRITVNKNAATTTAAVLTTTTMTPTRGNVIITTMTLRMHGLLARLSSYASPSSAVLL